MAAGAEGGDPIPVIIDHVFVYGTLRPGEVRWQFLEPYVEVPGSADAVRGHLFDTGLGYPAATFPVDGEILINGLTFRLHAASLDDALSDLDEVEGAVRGLYRRVPVTTEHGRTAWAYEYGVDPSDPDIALTRIDSGDWLAR